MEQREQSDAFINYAESRQRKAEGLTQSDCVAGQKAPHLRCWSLNAEMDAALWSASIKAEPAKGGGDNQFIQHGDMLKQMDILLPAHGR